MAKKPRSYGWSPEQMARINARREARGADLYIDKKMGGEDYMNRYESESGKYGATSASFCALRTHASLSLVCSVGRLR
jgi:hypothetical protein